MAENFLVTGALGCIGAWTSRLLAQEGRHVVVFDPGKDRHRLDLLLSPEEAALVEVVSGDITDLARIEEVLDAHEITNVIHLASLQIPFCRANPPLGAAVNVVGMVNLLEAVRTRADRMAPLVYAGSLAMFDASDVDATTGRLPIDAVATPRTHYGFYKQANEGNASVYWLDHGISSISLRPMTVYGPGRDQGMTSAGTVAMLAAAVGRDYHSPFGGSTLLNYAEDAARAFIAASRSSLTGAHRINLPGVTADFEDVIAAIDTAVPGAGARVTFESKELPFPDRADTDFDTLLPGLSTTPLQAGVAATIELFARRLAEGRLVPAEHGLK